MKATKVFFPTNIRFLRERKQITQEDCAQKLGISRIKLAALESGRTGNPTAIDLINFSEFFRISIDSLFKVDLTRLSELKLKELEAGNDVYLTGSNLRVLAITVDKDNKENMEYVPIKAKAGYCAGHNDPEFLAALPRFSLPNLPKGGTYRMFPTKGDSMLPIPEGSDIICSFIQDWQSIKDHTLCVVILKNEQDFVFKQVSLRERELLLQSLNPAYEPYTVPFSEVLELWAFHSYQSKEIPETTGDLQTVLKAIHDLRNEMYAKRSAQ
jgi:transcriptional regulator with XRE-family HTH domain